MISVDLRNIICFLMLHLLAIIGKLCAWFLLHLYKALEIIYCLIVVSNNILDYKNSLMDTSVPKSSG